MKPRKPLLRRTPLRARVGLTNRSELRRTPLAPVSKKAQRRNRERTAALRPLREAQTWCSRCGMSGVGLDAHEVVRRSQLKDAATNLAVIILLCRDCHRFVTDNPAAGHDEGWVIWSWEHRQEAG